MDLVVFSCVYIFLTFFLKKTLLWTKPSPTWSHLKSWGLNRVCPRGEVWRGVISNLDGTGWWGYDACNKLKCFSNNRHKMRACKSWMLILDSEVVHGCSTRIYQSMPNSNAPICCALSFPTQCPLSLLDLTLNHSEIVSPVIEMSFTRLKSKASSLCLCTVIN